MPYPYITIQYNRFCHSVINLKMERKEEKLDITYLDRDLICVLFPGIVVNDEKALECLGGIRGISSVYSQPAKKRLGLSFQPDNTYVKKIYADYKQGAGVLLKVKVKKVKTESEVKREVVSTSIMGRVKKLFRFESMCEFQYLAVSAESGTPKCIIDQIIPTGLEDSSFMDETAPLFIVPSSFTRSDKPITYSYTDKRYPLRVIFDDEVHHRIRSDRGGPTSHFTFNLVDKLPVEPTEYSLERFKTRLSSYPDIEREFQTVKKMFEERPVWSQNLIRYHTKYKITSLKVILPRLAVYMRDGPWRMLWIRYGYDPRKEPGARIYQTLDFRVRHQAGVHSMVMTRDNVVHYKKADRVRVQPRPNSAPQPSEEISEGAVMFRPGMAPSQRQIFYQFCDVHLPEVEALVGAEPPPGSLCHVTRGWLPASAGEVCRDHVFRYAKQTLLATRNAELKFEQDTSDEGGSTPASETDETLNNTV